MKPLSISSDLNVGVATSSHPTNGIYILTTLSPDGGTNHIDNRALLCQCNTKKSNTMSLTALRRENKREEYIQPHSPIDLQEALAWTKNYDCPRNTIPAQDRQAVIPKLLDS